MANKFGYVIGRHRRPLKIRTGVSYTRVLEVEFDSGSLVHPISLEPSIQFWQISYVPSFIYFEHLSRNNNLLILLI